MSAPGEGLDLPWLDGLFVGQLSEEERLTFEQGIKAGLAERSYSGVGGFLGMAKVRVLPISEARSRARAAAGKS